MKKLTTKAIEQLTREEKLHLLSLIEEKERRSKLKAEDYKPNEGQIKVHASDKTVRGVFTGNGSGKTALGVNEAVWAAKGFNPVLNIYTRVPARVIVVLDKPEKVTDVWLPEIRKWHYLDPEKQLHKRGKPYITQITFDNGSEILFHFVDQDPMTFESIEGDFFIFDEPPPRHVYIGLRRAGRKKGTRPKYLIIGTPIAAAWLRKEIYEPWAKGEAPDTECFKFGTKVNEANLAKGYIESFSAALSEKEKRIRLEGEFFDLEGLALAHLFDRDIHIVEGQEWDQSWPVVIGIDPHPNKKHVAVMLGCNPYGQFLYLKEYASKEIPRDFARSLKNWYRGYRIVDIVCDSLGSADYTGGEGNKSFIEVMNIEGVRARATTFEDKKDESWLMRIQDVLAIPTSPDNFGQRIPKLRIRQGNHGIVSDIESVQWMKYRNIDEYKPKLDISNKDYLAALKYALASNLSFMKGRQRAKHIADSAYGFKIRR